jgi:hypothetical protein
MKSALIFFNYESSGRLATDFSNRLRDKNNTLGSSPSVNGTLLIDHGTIISQSSGQVASDFWKAD